MRRRNGLRFTVALFGAAALCLAEGIPTKRVPILLELFTSEGCSSCPPADRLLAAFDQKQPVEGAELVVLSEHVDYWDDGGWKDPFSSSQYTERQQDYTKKLRVDGPYTPQLIVDGQAGVVGSNAAQAASAIRKAIAEKKIPITVTDASQQGEHIKAHISLPLLNSSGGALYVAIAANQAESQVARGENAGRSLTHVAVTLLLKRIENVKKGEAFSRDIALTLRSEKAAGPLRFVAFLEDSKSGRVLGVTALRL